MEKIFFLLMFLSSYIIADDFIDKVINKEFIYLDSIKINFIRKNNDKIIKEFKKFLSKNELSDSIKTKLLYKLGVAFYVKLQFDSSIVYLNKSMDLAEKKKLNKELSLIYRFLGLVYHIKSDFLNAIAYYQKAIEKAKLTNDLKTSASVLGSVGTISLIIGNYDDAILAYKEALKLNKDIDFKEGVAWDYYLIGKYYIKLNDFRNSIAYLDSSYNLYMNLAEEDNTCYIGAFIALFFKTDNLINEGKLKLALKVALKAKELAEKIPYQKLYILDAYLNLGKVYLHLKQYNKAISFLNKSLKITREIEHYMGEITCNYFISKSYFEIGDIKKALHFLKKAESIAQKHKVNTKLVDIYKFYNEIYKSKNNYKKALYYLTKQYEINSFLKNEELQNKIIGFKVRHSIDNMIKENKALKKNIKIQEKLLFVYKVLIILVVIIILILVCFVIYLYKTSRKIKEMNRVLEDKNKEIEEKNKKLYIKSITDELTGLYNRTYLYDYIIREISRAKRHNKPLSLIMFDIDNFKKINDIYGHLAGDYVLKEISAIFKHNLRKEDIAVRFGGEEICVILPETDLDIAYKVADKIRKAIEETDYNYNQHSIKVTVSGGVSSFEKEEDRALDNILNKADDALFRAKKEGKNIIVKYAKGDQ